MAERRTFRRLLPLFLLLAGCKTTNVAERQQALPSEQTELEASSPQPAETHQNIAKAMFPNAPEKTHSADCFRTLRPEMSMQAVVQKCGRPDEEVGSGPVFTFVWHMPDGSSVSIDTPTLEKIGNVKYDKQSGSN